LDSLVLIDDSESEIELIRQVVPQAVTIHFKVNKAVEYRDVLASCGLFDTLSITAEDRLRGELYQAETGRKKLAEQFDKLEAYYQSLEMVVAIHPAAEFSIPRIVQLTQRTNQFNLTAKRYSESEITELAGADNSDVLYIQIGDRFGDIGIIVGASVLKYEENRAVIDLFLLSCRAQGRKIEEVFLAYCLKLAQNRGAVSVTGEYIAMDKNMQVKDFYEKTGFTVIQKTEKISVANCDIRHFELTVPGFFKMIVSEIS
jgi:FkbH-like protein